MPQRLRGNAQRHAFNLERFRHGVGDKSLPILSAYRTAAYNRVVGGATRSQHIQADATDFAKGTVDRIGRKLFYAVAERVFKDGGVGRYPAGSAHLDSRGTRARWSSY